MELGLREQARDEKQEKKKIVRVNFNVVGSDRVGFDPPLAFLTILQSPLASLCSVSPSGILYGRINAGVSNNLIE